MKEKTAKIKLIIMRALPCVALIVVTLGILMLTVKNKNTPAIQTTQPETEEITTVITTETTTEETTAEETAASTTKKIVIVGTTKPVEKETVKIENREIAATVTPIKILDVPYINQNASYPTGCEAVSAVMALRYAGYGISVDAFINNYLPKQPTPFVDEAGNYYGYDPRKSFLGDPYSPKGWGCCAPVITKSINSVINHKKHQVKNITGSSMEMLCKYIDQGYPVVMWATQGMSAAKTGKTWEMIDSEGTYTWISPNHCLVLVGYDASGYYFNDPQTHKNCRYPADIVRSRFASLGCQAVVIVDYIAPETTTETTTEEASSEELGSEEFSEDITVTAEVSDNAGSTSKTSQSTTGKMTTQTSVTNSAQQSTTTNSAQQSTTKSAAASTTKKG